MVSFSCETCGDILKKPKLDQHAQRCWAVYTCIDCNVTFRNSAEWSKHVSCMSEEQRYHKSVYKAPKGKGQKGQQNGTAPAAPAAVPVAGPESVASEAKPKAVESAPVIDASESKDKKKSKKDKKRAREEEDPKVVEQPAKATSEEKDVSEATPSQKKSKKDKKAKKGEVEGSKSNGEATVNDATSQPSGSIQSFLAGVVPSLLAESRPFASLKKEVVAKAKAEGWDDSAAVEAALLEGIMVGGDKPKKMLRLAFDS